VIAGEAAIFATRFLTNVSFLWYNVIGCVVVITTALAISAIEAPGGTIPAAKAEGS